MTYNVFGVTLSRCNTLLNQSIAAAVNWQLSTVCSNAPILREDEAETMNKGIHIPLVENQAHGKLRVKSEIG